MMIKKLTDVPMIKMEGFDGLTKQIVIGTDDGSNEIVMRYFTLQPGTSSPHHAHEYPHLIRIEAGKGTAVDNEGKVHPVEAGDFLYVPDNSTHQITATGPGKLEFICIVPSRGEM